MISGEGKKGELQSKRAELAGGEGKKGEDLIYKGGELAGGEGKDNKGEGRDDIGGRGKGERRVKWPSKS